MKESLSVVELERRNRYLEQQNKALCEIGISFDSTSSLDVVLTDIVHRTCELMTSERASLFLIEDDDALVSRILVGDELTEISLGPGQGLAGWAARHRRPILVADAYDDERFDRRWDEQSGYRTRDVLVHPIIGNTGNIIGVIEVLNKIDGNFDELDLGALGLLSDQLALIIENSRLLIDLVRKNRSLADSRTSLERENRELKISLDLEQMVSQAESIDTLSTELLNTLLELFHCKVGVFYTIDSGGAEMRTVVGDVPGRRVLRVGSHSGFSGWVATRGEEICLNSAAGDPRYDQHLEERTGIPMENVCAVPLRISPDAPVQGSLLVANKTIGPRFDQYDLSILRLVASHLARAMQFLHSRQERERERRLATVGRLLAGILHDLKSPITVISGYTELLASKVGDEQSDEYLDHVHRALGRISALAGEIISFSKGEQQVLLSTVRLTDFIDYFVKEVQPHLDANNIEFKVHVRSAGTVRMDEEKFYRALFNIVINAIEAMGRKGELLLEVDEIGDEVIFGITDNGPGIPEAIQGSIFESFVTQGKDHGTGLGLSVSREIVEDHHGTITFSTAEGKGTTFVIALPSIGSGSQH